MEKESNKMTAVQWLIEDLGEYFPHGVGGIELMVKKALQMEKEQIINAYIANSFIRLSNKAEQYYEQIYGGNNEQQ
jgi:hypothetical protein